MSQREPKQDVAREGEAPAGGSRLTETTAIALLERVLTAGQRQPGVRHGIGDDAAVLTSPSADLVWTVDASLEGTHFDLRWLTLEDVGWRSFHAAVSDIAAMGAIPLAALSSVALPLRSPSESLEAFARGQADAARVCGCPVVGGNLARAGSWQITTTVLGTVEQPLLRAGGRAGDELWVVGRVGMAAAGLRLLQRDAASAATLSGAARDCLSAWRRPRALLREGRQLLGRAHAAMDVSDGLAADLPKLATASGVRIVVESGLLRESLHPSLVEVASQLGIDALDLALEGGEDYALIGCGRSKNRPDIAVAIGRVEEGRGAVLALDSLTAVELRGGFDHLATAG